MAAPVSSPALRQTDGGRDYERQISEIATGKAAYTLACLKGLMRGLMKHKGTLDPEIVRNIVEIHEARQAQAGGDGG